MHTSLRVIGVLSDPVVSLPVLYQCTHSVVISSRSARALSRASPTVPTEGISPARISVGGEIRCGVP